MPVGRRGRYPTGWAVRYRKRGARGRSKKSYKIRDFLMNVYTSDTAAAWNNSANIWETMRPQYSACYLADTHTQPGLTIIPITVRNTVLAKLQYYAQLYDSYRIKYVKLQYTPSIPVTTPGILCFHYEPNVTTSPLVSANTVINWPAYITRQKYGRMTPCWMATKFTVIPRGGWLRCSNPANMLDINTTMNAVLPDPLRDYGCFYVYNNAKPAELATQHFQMIGFIHIIMAVTFRDFSFGNGPPGTTLTGEGYSSYQMPTTMITDGSTTTQETKKDSFTEKAKKVIKNAQAIIDELLNPEYVEILTRLKVINDANDIKNANAVTLAKYRQVIKQVVNAPAEEYGGVGQFKFKEEL